MMAMSTTEEIEEAFSKLPLDQRMTLFISLSGHLETAGSTPSRTHRQLDPNAYPALEGLPADLSVGTKDKVQALMINRHGPDR